MGLGKSALGDLHIICIFLGICINSAYNFKEIKVSLSCSYYISIQKQILTLVLILFTDSKLTFWNQACLKNSNDCELEKCWKKNCRKKEKNLHFFSNTVQIPKALAEPSITPETKMLLLSWKVCRKDCNKSRQKYTYRSLQRDFNKSFVR